jgi:hypothetical protein
VLAAYYLQNSAKCLLYAALALPCGLRLQTEGASALGFYVELIPWVEGAGDRLRKGANRQIV